MHTSFWPPGLRLRILAPAALVAIPAVALLLYTSFDRLEQAERAVTDNAERFASLKALDQGRLIEGARQLLIALSWSRDVREGDGEACSTYLRQVVPQFGAMYTNIGVVDTAGAIVCSSLPGAGISLADRTYVQRALATKGFVIGEYTVGRQTGRPSLPFALPVLDDGGAVRRVLFATVDAARLSESLASDDWPDSATIIITDREHTILATHPGGKEQLGRSLRNGPLTLRMGAQTSGVIEHVEDGVAEVLAFKRLQPLESGVTVRVYVTKTQARAAALSSMYRTLAIFGVVACVIIAGMHLASDRLLMRPIAQLTSVSRRLAAGDLRARAGHTTIPELNRLGEDFDAMAAALEERESARLIAEMERKEIEQHYHRAQKMDAIGRLAGGIAHDFNNMLTAILGYCELLLDDPSVSENHRADIREIEKAGRTAAQLTRQLLAFSRREIVEPVVLDLNAIISGVDKLLTRLVGEHIEMETSLAPDLHTVRADRAQIEQVILNLAVNARDAMPQGGRLAIETANAHLSDGVSSAYLECPPGDYVMLAVKDTGSGIEPDVLQHLFEPFFTTKGHGKGTGLGLATVYGIAKQNNGGVEVESSVGKGSVFKIYFPRCHDAVASAVLPAPAERAANGKATILIVEDDPGIRELSTKILSRYGYNVLAAAGGEEARLVSECHDGVIDLLLSDVVMPGMNGPMVAEMLTRMRPELKVVFMSGYTDNAVVRHGVMGRNLPFLQKPFTPERLANKIVEVLG